MLTLMNRVWRYEVGTLGYRPPPSDGKRGGDARYDVYLKEVFGQGLYGLSVPERPVHVQPPRPTPATSSSTTTSPVASSGPTRSQTARVTAAHEFFHAIQFGYDVAEDHWLMESTATWMEEQFADSSNDNRQYLPSGQLAHPNTPLDTFTATRLPAVRQLALLRVPQRALRPRHRPHDLGPGRAGAGWTPVLCPRRPERAPPRTAG